MCAGATVVCSDAVGPRSARKGFLARPQSYGVRMVRRDIRALWTYPRATPTYVANIPPASTVLTSDIVGARNIGTTSPKNLEAVLTKQFEGVQTVLHRCSPRGLS